MKIKGLELDSVKELQFLPIFIGLDVATDAVSTGQVNYDDEYLNMIVRIAITHKMSFPFLRAMAKSLYKEDKDKCLAVNDFLSLLEDKYIKSEEED